MVLKRIDSFLDKITMYRLTLWFLIILFACSVFLSLIGLIPANPLEFLLFGAYVLFSCFIFNQIFARIFKVKTNFESQFITALILVLIIGPFSPFEFIHLITLVCFFAMASKYLVVFKKQHIFNPAAFGVIATAIIFGYGVGWWLGEEALLPIIIAGGFLIARKTSRSNMILAFLISYSLFFLIFNYSTIDIQAAPSILASIMLSTTTLFFAFVMLTEPITSPADRRLRLYFGLLTGFLAVLYQSFFNIFYGLELALLTSNLVGRLVLFSHKYVLVLVGKKEIGKNIWQFIFEPDRKISFSPGQFMEWTLPHKADNRGTRRYFTISSSPTEENIALTVKVNDNSSSYKKALLSLDAGGKLFATNLEGEFVLQKNLKSYVFVAGGIGVTPFRSIIKYLIDNNLSEKITLFYISHDEDEFVFEELFKQAEKSRLKVVYIVSEGSESWKGEKGRLSEDLIEKYVPDYKRRIFYLSGPQQMVTAYKDLIIGMGVPKSNIKTDYFPGYQDTAITAKRV